jgi:hypothetical protein
MIDAASSMLGNRIQLQREEISMSIMKSRIQAEQAMAQMLMDAAKNIEQIAGSASSGTRGGIIDVYA